MKHILLKLFCLIFFLLAILFILENHYVAIGECAAWVYYYPLDRWDYVVIPLVGFVILSLSLYCIHTSLKMRVIEAFIYVSIIIFTLTCGNNILASRTIDWPEVYHVYHVQPL